MEHELMNCESEKVKYDFYLKQQEFHFELKKMKAYILRHRGQG